jgi:hypothetical protein
MPDDGILPGLPRERVLAAYRKAAGNEIDSGKFFHPESSAALVANTFGLFLDAAHPLPLLPDTDTWGWPATSVELECSLRFPWAGGRHPWFDALTETAKVVIGVESKRYEPYRGKKLPAFEETYWRPVGLWRKTHFLFPYLFSRRRARVIGVLRATDSTSLLPAGIRDAIRPPSAGDPLRGLDLWCLTRLDSAKSERDRDRQGD